MLSSDTAECFANTFHPKAFQFCERTFDCVFSKQDTYRPLISGQPQSYGIRLVHRDRKRRECPGILIPRTWELMATYLRYFG